LQGLRLSTWKLVDQALVKALEAWPKQPFLLLVKAWSLTQQGGHDAAEVIELLRQVARGGSIELLRPFADQSVAALDDGQLYELLLEQPVARRRVADWENLARLAERAGRRGDAIAHWKAAIEQAGPAGDDPERELQLVQLLLETRRSGEAVALAQARAARKNTRPEVIASLAEALHQWGAVSEASKLIREALADKDLTGKRRQKLLHRRANLETGLARWRTLLEAVESLPSDSNERVGLIHTILGDLTDAAQSEQAGELGNETKDKTAQAAFRLRQAELYLLRSNVDAAADIAWKLYETKELPADRFEWLCGRLAAARQDARLIRAVEDALRTGKTVSPPLLDLLAVAYEAQGRTGAARRARTNAHDLKPPPAPPAPVQGGIGFGGGFFDVP
jgi:tetratricopeptide (TPR) repeat protein